MGHGGVANEPLRALLLTDVVDSTRLSESLGDDAMSRLWAAHDRVARDLMRRWRGREIDRSDGFLLMFDDTGDAVDYALEYHAALAALPTAMRARAGLHFGPVRLRENGADDVALGAKPLEVEGLAKPLAARIMSLAQGGQTLLSVQARDSLGTTPHRTMALGHWRLKGLADPIELYEVGDETAPFAPPADTPKAYRVLSQRGLWLPLREVRHSLPAERDEFVGRRENLLELAMRFDNGARLVSLLGIGGCGKTRLATRFAWTWLGDFSGGSWFCDLSQARDVDGVASAVAHGLDVPLGKDDPIQQLGSAIAGHGDCLVILDNFEQVARLAEETLGRWLDRASRARFLVTTREVLGIAGEQTMALAPLPMVEAEDLFVRRARAARRDFEPGADDRAAIGPLVKLLDGLPLAIELCAVRVRIMPPRLLLQRMGERFRLLSSGGRRHDRQATLRAAFDWSWDLLTLHERRALAQLAVFEGGFSLEAAEAVLDLGDEGRVPWTPDVVQSLVDKSFVVDQSRQRFSMLGSVQEYAVERLRGEWPDDVSAVRLRHRRHFANLTEADATSNACADLANLVAACRASFHDGDAQTAVGALRGAWAALLLRGPYRLGIELGAQVRAIEGLTDTGRLWVEWVEGSALRIVGRQRDAEVLLSAAADKARAEQDRALEARIRIGLGAICTGDGRMDLAREYHAAALRLADDIGDTGLRCEALSSLGTLCDLAGEAKDARRYHESALRLARESRLRRWQGGALGNLGLWFANQGQTVEARQHFEDSLEAAVEVGDKRWEGNALCNLGLLDHVLGRLDPARDRLLAALRVGQEIGSDRLACFALGNLGLVDWQAGRASDALVHYGQALDMARRIGDQRAEGQFLGYLALLQGQQGSFDEARRNLTEGQGLLAAMRDRFSVALLLAQRAEVEWLAGDQPAALDSAVRAVELAEEFGATPETELGMQLQRIRSWYDRAGKVVEPPAA